MTRSKVRRERMGHIVLAAPVSHIWYFKGFQAEWACFWTCLLVLWKKVLYFVSYIVTDSGDTSLMKKQLLTETEYREYRDKYGDAFPSRHGSRSG